MDESSQLRVSDQDREEVTQDLRYHFAVGRLNQDELDERVQAAYGARTETELRAVTADLPKVPATVQQQRAELAERRRSLQRRLLQEAGGGIGLFALCTGVWAASGASGMFWPIWIVLVTLIPLLRNGWRLYGPAPQLDQVERELERRERHSRGGPHGRHRHRRRL